MACRSTARPAVGPPGGKTFVAHVVGQALGLDPAGWYREVAKQPDGGLWGRTIARDGGRYEFTAAAVPGGPFVCLDELGDARGDKQTAGA